MRHSDGRRGSALESILDVENAIPEHTYLSHAAGVLANGNFSMVVLFHDYASKVGKLPTIRRE